MLIVTSPRILSDFHLRHVGFAWYDRFKEIPMTLTATFMKVPEGYIAFVDELPGVNTQGDTLEEARENLKDAVIQILEANRELAID